MMRLKIKHIFDKSRMHAVSSVYNKICANYKREIKHLDQT